jgi:hypothetical protein
VASREEAFGLALVGKLQDIPPAEIMVFLSESAKTGKLTFTTGTQEGMIVFREGKIIYAASSTIRETFGSIALALKIVDRAQIDKAVRLQHRSGEDKRLGEILVSIGAMTEQDIQRVLAHQVGQVVREIFEWETGYFRFRNLEIEDRGDVEVDARDLVVDAPLDTRSVALDAARERDEQALQKDVAEEGEQPTTLAQMMSDVAGPALTAETIEDIFRVAGSVLSRGVIFAIRDHSAQGLVQYGLEATDVVPDQRIRDLWFPLDEYSLISRVVEDRETFRGVPDHVRANTKLIRTLGGEWPDEAVAIPMMIGDRVALVFYGDNRPSGLPIASTEALEAVLTAVGERLTAAGC